MSVQEHVITALGAALDGEWVAIFAADWDESGKFFQAAVSLAPEGCEIRRTNGQQRIGTRNGGVLHFFSVRSQGNRGVSLDRAYVPAALADEDVALSIEASLATSKRPQFIGYL